ncbi:MAG: sensor domain-containing diguanylate cyclase [Gammaproteobacteria bacterium]|nr:sensor domain-containing diguanylate cyclase [Gammaproteobacteria bacterium]
MEMAENEKVIRELYEITSHHEIGFPAQVEQLLALGCQRFAMEIGILSKIDGDKYQVVHQVSPKEVPLDNEVEFDLDQTYCALTLNSDGPVGIEHMGDSEYSQHPAYEAFKLEAYIGMPITVDGKRYGTLNFSSPYPYRREFNEIDIDALKLMAIWLEGELSRQQFQAQIMQQAEQLAEQNELLKTMAHTDNLTKVGNRFSLFTELENQLMFAQRLKIPVSLVLFDLDDFKEYNDSYGHVAGDNALVEVARVVKDLARTTDYVARYGGEEFIVILPDTNLHEAVSTAERFSEALGAIKNLERTVTCSFGVSTYQPTKDIEIDYNELSERLIDQADQAMYHSKHAGKNCVNHYAKLGLSLRYPGEANG